MEHYRFHLQKYHKGSKTTCPKCGQPKCFARYVDDEGIVTFPYEVGRCDHDNHCGYHYPPAAYFRDHPEVDKNGNYGNCWSNKPYQRIAPVAQYKELPPQPLSFIERSLLEQSLQQYGINPLHRYLSKIFGKEETDRLFALYKVGTSKKWDGSTVYWQTDYEGNVRTGKIMKYDADTGHRIREPASCVTWVHAELRKPDFVLRQCFFGEHLLSDSPDKPVGIVESEKTAIIATHFMPGFVWLATGGKNGCFNKDAASALKDRDAMLVPDLGATDCWKAKLPMLQTTCRSVSVSNILEESATDEQRTQGLDIADFLLMTETPQMILQRMIDCHPALQMLIDNLHLEIVDSF